MAADIHSREQRLRKQAELQSLRLNLANLRERETSYIAASAVIPELLVNQINDQRHQIQRVEDELLALGEEPAQPPGRQLYREAYEAELAGDFDKALRLYKSAARSAQPDADAAGRSVRYRLRSSKSKVAMAGQSWPASDQSRNRWLVAAAAILILGSFGILMANGLSSEPSEEAVAVEPLASATPTPVPPEVILIVPETPTLEPTRPVAPTATPTVLPPTPTPEILASSTPIPSPTPTLRPAPRVLEPKDGLVWLDGTIVFEFVDLDLAYDELYCLNTMRGYDSTLTENWSFPPVGNKRPAIPIEANVFRVAKTQGMKCIVWSAAIGKNSCDNIISQNTEERVIGLPRPCEFK
jgi:hypothetical protein